MQIVPMKELKKTVEIEHKCASSIIEEANLINRGILDYEEGRVVDGASTLKRLKEKLKMK